MRSFALLLVSVLSVLATVAAKAQTPLTTAFTYQGELAATGTPAAGAFDLRFRLFDASTGGTQIGGTLCSDNLAVAGGRFLVSLDFGAAAFAGQGRFLEIEVRADTGLACANPAGFTILGPRQSISPTPYAIFATSASNAATATNATNATNLGGLSAASFQNASNLGSGTLPSPRLSGAYANALSFSNASNLFAGNGAAITSLNATNIATGTVADERLPANLARLNLSNTFSGAINVFNGQIGVNAGTPLADLHVRPVGTGTLGKLLITPSASDSSAQLTLAENTSASLGAILRYDGVANQLQMIGLTTGGVETDPHMRIERNTGRVGIGVTPETRLHVASGSAGVVGAASTAVAILENAGDAFLQFQTPDANASGLAFGDPTGGVTHGKLAFEPISTTRRFAFSFGGSEPLLTFSALGDLSIGNTAESGALNVTGPTTLRSSSSVSLTMTSSSTTAGFTGDSTIFFQRGTVIADPTIVRFASMGKNDDGLFFIPNRERTTAGVLTLTSSRAFITSPLSVTNIGGNNAQVAPVLRLQTQAAEGDDIISMSGTVYAGAIRRDGGGVAYTGFTGLHTAWGEGIQTGDLVLMTGASTSLRPVEDPASDPEPVYGIAPATIANSPSVLGVARFAFDIKQATSRDNPWTVASVGNTHVWIVDTGRDVLAGDSLITSDIRGCAQLDDAEKFEIGNIFGRAAESIDWSKISTGTDGVKRARISVLLDAAVRDSRPSAALQQRVQDLESRLQALEAMLGVQGQNGK